LDAVIREGVSHFFAPMTSTIAVGRSISQVGLACTGKHGFVTVCTNTRHIEIRVQWKQAGTPD
jgi:hypothetical protein